MIYSKIEIDKYNKKNDFTNQIFAILTAIIMVQNTQKKIVVVDKFLNDILKTEYTPISEILDLEYINNYLKNTYSTIIIDGCNYKFNLLDIKYGNNHTNIDITENIKNLFMKDNCLNIPKNIIFNNIKGDPLYGTEKNLFIKYELNNYTLVDIYNENLSDDIIMDNNENNYIPTYKWITDINKNIFEDLLINIKFNNSFIEKSNIFIDKVKDDKINVVHLILEDDILTYWSNKNGFETNQFKTLLENKYIELITKFIKKNHKTIILSENNNNNVIEFLKNNNYNYVTSEKFFDDREKNAIVDLLISKYCNNVFIGNFNINKLNGSPFSYYMIKLLDKESLKVCIDLDNINNKIIFID